jgi:FixJ family two-component response regulator
MVFIVDDDYAVRDCLGLIIETSGFVYQSFESAERFLQAYSQSMHDCLLLDIDMPGMNGLELQDELIRRNVHLPIIFISAHVDLSTKARAIKAGAFDFLTKPVPSQLLIERIRTLLQHEAQMNEKVKQ